MLWEWIAAFTPPEWQEWNWLGRVTYVISICCFMGLILLGGFTLKLILTGQFVIPPR